MICILLFYNKTQYDMAQQMQVEVLVTSTNGQVYHRTVQYNPETKNLMYLDSPTSTITYELHINYNGNNRQEVILFI